MRQMIAIVGLVLSSFFGTAVAQQTWVEGKHYFLIRPAAPTSVEAGKVEVAEAFSYACPACYSFHPIAKQLEAALPANAKFIYQHASFNSAESWPLFQRAYLTAEALGIREKTHDAMLRAIWETGELAVVDKRTNRLKNPQPTLEQVAAFYEKNAGVKAADFIAAAKSFGVQAAINRTEAWLRAARIESTPTIVVNGKYRLTAQSAGGINEMIDLVDYLVEKESAASVSR
jgi:thiol:disulfide interchange protein DsbA